MNRVLEVSKGDNILILVDHICWSIIDLCLFLCHLGMTIPREEKNKQMIRLTISFKSDQKFHTPTRIGSSHLELSLIQLVPPNQHAQAKSVKYE